MKPSCRSTILAMHLDPRTLLVAAMSVSVFVAALALLIGRVNGLRAATEIGITVLLLAAGFTLIALRGIVEAERLSVYGGAAFTLAGSVWLNRAARGSRELPLRDVGGWVLAALALLAMAVLHEAGVRPGGMVSALHTAVMAILVGRAAWLYRQERRPSLKVPRDLTVGVLALTSVMLLVRSALVLNAPEFTVLKQGGSGVALLMGVGVFVLGTAFGVIWLEVARLQSVLSDMAGTDPLTGLRNRRSFGAEFERELARYGRGGGEFSIAMFDLDRFKSVNDRHGHACGDYVLREFAQLLLRGVRAVDIAGRYGGEEFVVLMIGAAKHTALGVAERVRRATAEAELRWNGLAVPLTVSAGVATVGEDGSEAALLLQAADAALYASKAAGRDRVGAAGAL